MRWDRFITLNVARPLCRGLTGNSRLPVLMYHSITDAPESRVSAYYQTNTKPAVFREHLRCLKEQGYRALTVSQVVNWLEGALKTKAGTGADASEKCVAITFDDGFKDFYTEAFQAIREQGFTATMFLPTAFIGDSGSTIEGGLKPRCSFKGTECLTWSEIREMRDCGIEFGSHTVSHRKLVDLPWSEVERELRESKELLEQRLGTQVTTFAYPFAFPEADQRFTTRLRHLLVQLGYSCCATTEIGRLQVGDDPYRLKRLPANSLDDLALFRAKLEGSYDWLAPLQRTVKRVKRLGRSLPPKASYESAAARN